MFGAFSKLFKKSEPAPAPARLSTPPASPPPPAHSAGAVPKDETAARGGVPRSAAAIKPGEAITVPYSSIIKVIPQELWGKLAPAGVAGYNYTLSRKTVLEQLPHGAVKVNFGELRRGAPTGVFVNTSAEDGRMVDLPLSEILEQLHPDSISRRSDQTRVEVSSDVPDLFGAKGERLAPLRVIEKKELSTSMIARQKGGTTITPKKVAGPPGKVPAPAAPANIAPVQPKVPAPAAPASQTPIRMQPVVPAPAAPAAKPAGSVPIATPKPVASPAPATKPLPKLPAAAVPASKPVAPIAPAAVPVPSAPLPGLNTGSFFIRLDAIAMNWPDGIRQELAQLKIPDAKVALPPVDICDGLKRGRIQFPWRTLRAWIQPTPIYATPSPHDDEMLELPLRTLTPLFLEFIRSNPVNRQAADAENITEFFRRAEQASGATAELMQPLFPVPAQPVAPAPAAQSQSESDQPASQSSSTTSSGSSQLAVENNQFLLPVAVIAAGCPEPVQHDIASFNLSGSRIEIPLEQIEPGLKSGRIEFTWRELAGWLNPPSKPAQISINGEQKISLPLGMVAPLFMKARAGAGARRRTMVDQEIPDLFSANGKPLAQAAAVTQESAAAAPAPAPAPTVPAPRKVPTNLSELFNEPTKKTWTPNEIVQYSAKLPCVAGTLIALQDGLLVAANMPQDLKTETIAAFVPQIFGRMNQYSNELKMGETTAVSFNVEAGTFQIYNAGIIYFAAFARKGDLLPLPELQLIAGELSRHTK